MLKETNGVITSCHGILPTNQVITAWYRVENREYRIYERVSILKKYITIGKFKIPISRKTKLPSVKPGADVLVIYDADYPEHAVIKGNEPNRLATKFST